LAVVLAGSLRCGTSPTTLGTESGDAATATGCPAGDVYCSGCAGGGYCAATCGPLVCPGAPDGSAAMDDGGDGGGASDAGNGCPPSAPVLCRDCSGAGFCVSGACAGFACPVADSGGPPPDAGDSGPSPDASAVDAGLDLDSGVFAPDGACECQPYWCGCGVCDPAQIACTVGAPACARGCLSSCVALTQVACSCDLRGRCVRSGVDAATIGCMQTRDCPVGDCCARTAPASDTTGSCVAAPNASCN
jgi:hypothetical protein